MKLHHCFELHFPDFICGFTKYGYILFHCIETDYQPDMLGTGNQLGTVNSPLSLLGEFHFMECYHKAL